MGENSPAVTLQFIEYLYPNDNLGVRLVGYVAALQEQIDQMNSFIEQTPQVHGWSVQQAVEAGFIVDTNEYWELV